MEILPFTDDYDQRFITQLGDEKYVIDSRWNERGQTWSFDLTRDSDQVQLLSGAPLQIGVDVLAPYALGIGGLIVSDLGRKDTDAGPEDLGSRVIVAYLSPEELSAIKAILGPAGASIVASGVVPPLPTGGGSSGGGGGGGGSGSTVINNVTIENTALSVSLSGAGGFGGTVEYEDSSGDEVLILRDIGLASVNPTMALVAAVLASGDGRIRIYTGGVYEAIGSTGTPSGTLRDSKPVSGAGENTYDLSNTFANPGGLIPIKVTMQSSAPGTDIGVSIIRGGLA
jgi:hypothetical protein